MRYTLFLIILLFNVPTVNAQSLSFVANSPADATYFNPSIIPLSAQSNSDSIAVGTVAIWTQHKIPENWLECNGSTISENYPELQALVGKNTPDYRGIFLRGLGGNSADLGNRQGDAIRNIVGEFGSDAYGIPNGAFSQKHVYRSSDDGGGGGHYIATRVFNASNVVPTANENRPINIAVKYIIKAK